MLQNWTYGLGRRLALAMVLVTGGFVALGLFVNVQFQKQSIERRLEARIDQLGSMIVNVTSSYLYELRISDLEILYQDFLSQDDILNLQVIDPDEVVLVSGGGYEDDLSFLALADDELARRVITDREPLIVFRPGCVEVALPVELGNDFLGVVRFDLDLQPFEDEVSEVWWRNIISGLILLFVGLIVSLVISEKVTRSLHELIATTDRAAAGDLDQNIVINSHDELEHLARSFNTMLQSLRQSMAEVRLLAYCDRLTGLPNRAQFTEELEFLLDANRSNGRGIALLFLDLDRFKSINDTLGHRAGDQLLIVVADRLRLAVKAIVSCGHLPASRPARRKRDLPEGTLIARLGGDEFVILVRADEVAETARMIASRIVSTFQDPIMIAGQSIIASTSIGIAVANPGDHSPDELLQEADMARYEAKRSGRNNWRMSEPKSAPL